MQCFFQMYTQATDGCKLVDRKMKLNSTIAVLRYHVMFNVKEVG